MRATGAQTEIFGGRTGFLNRGTSINTSCVTYKRRASQGKIFVFFLQNNLKITLQMRI